MALVPLTFAYAIVRFRLFDVQVIVGKSIVYAILTAIVTGLYALAVVTGNALVSSQTSSSRRPSSPSRSVSRSSSSSTRSGGGCRAIVDRVFFRDRADFQSGVPRHEPSVVSQLERDKISELLTVRTAELLRLERLDLLTPRPEDGALSTRAARAPQARSR